jgi:hypothetical protein
MPIEPMMPESRKPFEAPDILHDVPLTELTLALVSGSPHHQPRPKPKPRHGR